jgi:CHAD domain-containing protein
VHTAPVLKIMATGHIAASSPGEHRGLTYWMERVLKDLELVRAAPEAEAVHDLRVAIRRCRSVAAVLEEADPSPAWPQMRKLPRKLFRDLGGLRDVQVLADWTRQLSAESDPIRERLLADLSMRESELREEVVRVAAKFDQKAWRKLESALRARARLAPANGLAAECLALERLEAAKELHSIALRTTKPQPWHTLRIGVKRFRYTVESLLPARCEEWGSDLKQMQDLLGEVHDLDVLADAIQKLGVAGFDGSRQAWAERIAIERNNRLESYRQLTLGRANLWQAWRQSLPSGRRLEAAGLSRLRVTVRALDRNPRRSGQVFELAMRLYDELGKVRAAAVFRAVHVRRIMRAASRVHGIGSGLDSKRPQKAARDFLLKMPLPAGWTEEEWQLAAMIVRYHRGAEPQIKRKGFSTLGEEERTIVFACSGVLRLARVLRKCGVESSVGIKMEKSVDALIVRIPGLPDTEETAAEIGAGKHLLEMSIGCPLLLKAVAAMNNVVELPQRTALSAVASD